MSAGVPLLDLQAQYAGLRADIDAAMAEVVESQRFILGPTVERFEAAIGAFIGTPHAVGCASGTDALLLALRALELEPGSEVLVPSFTFFATAGAVWNAGLRPVFADVDPVTYNLTPETVEAALTPNTRAVIVVHLFGQMADMAGLMRLAEERGLRVIEDVAQALGARQGGEGAWRNAGAIGDLGCFSFFPSKILGGFGDGGLVTAREPDLADRVRKLRVHGGTKMYHHEMVGTNSRLDALQAAVLAAKLPRVPEWIEARRAHAAAYDAALAALAPDVRTPVAASGNEHVYGVYTVRAERRDALQAHLAGRSIGNAVYYPVPLHLQACFAELGYRAGDLPASEAAAAEVLSLPIYPELTPEQRGRVAEAVAAFYG